MIAIIDYGVGNLFSIQNALNHLGISSCITADAAKIKAATKIILPGVGAYTDAMRCLEKSGVIPTLTEQVEKGIPLLGICLGMQLLYEKSSEYGETKGLGWIAGVVVSMHDTFTRDLKIPHMGWNTLLFKKDDPLLANIALGSDVYFVHSYYIVSKQAEYLAVSEYEVEIPAIIRQKNIYGMQFHPEKSGEVGLQLLANFAKI
ncbi:imidazole glycerol phosphate synthase glutamine amidotransferase subunit [Erysipelotrichaceae bacterium]|nr:imidazole glycerol phosphate synthase glutamine amidotransferase subunit [Erysipelotrichaceae bacterium]